MFNMDRIDEDEWTDEVDDIEQETNAPLTGEDRSIFLELARENLKLMLEKKSRIGGLLDWAQKILLVSLDKMNIGDVTFEINEAFVPDFQYCMYVYRKKLTLYKGTAHEQLIDLDELEKADDVIHRVCPNMNNQNMSAKSMEYLRMIYRMQVDLRDTNFVRKERWDGY